MLVAGCLLLLDCCLLFALRLDMQNGDDRIAHVNLLTFGFEAQLVDVNAV